MDQRSDLWHLARAGVLTGTCARDMLARIKTGEAACRAELRTRLALERLTGVPLDENGYVSKDMLRGIELEPEACGAYEAYSGEIVRHVGFLVWDDLPIGCSPDGLIGDDGLLELKCPKTVTHWRYVKAGTLPPEYLPQVTHNLIVSGAAWCDFVSYDPRFLPRPLFVVRVTRGEVDLKGYEAAMRAFLAEVETELDEMRGLTVGVA